MFLEISLGSGFAPVVGVEPKNGRVLVALTGIEPDGCQFSSVHLGLSGCVFSPVGIRGWWETPLRTADVTAQSQRSRGPRAHTDAAAFPKTTLSSPPDVPRSRPRSRPTEPHYWILGSWRVTPNLAGAVTDRAGVRQRAGQPCSRHRDL